MQKLAEICVRRPVFTWVLMLIMLVFGGTSFFRLGLDRFPNIDFPIVIVSTVLTGASPEQIETEISEPIEEALNAISGLDELRSSSYEGLSVVVARFDLDKDIDVAAQEVRDRIDRIMRDLPEGIDPPQVQQVDPDEAPILQVAVISSRSAREVTEYADQVILPRIESLNGVGRVSILGGREREIHVIADPGRLESYGLTIMDVRQALATENIELPGGDVERGSQTLQLRVQGRIQKASDFNHIPVAVRDGRVIRISDVAEVRDAEQDPESTASLNGESVVILSIVKQSGANTVAVIDALRERVAELQKEIPPSYRLQIVRDESEFIRNAVFAVQEHLILGGIFAALVVLFFLRNGRSTIIAALAMPTSIIATFALLAAMDLTLNTITLLALTLSVGIVIDDAIIVLENIVRFIDEKQLDPRRAAILATKEIGLAVLATTLSLVAVFLPIAFMDGIIGRFMGSFGLTMAFAIMVSLLVAFTLTPMLSSRWLKGPVKPREPVESDVKVDDLEVPDPPPEPRAVERERYAQWARGEVSALELQGHVAQEHASGALYERFERLYMRALALVMRHRWAVGIAIILVLASTVPLFIFVPKTFLPTNDESRFEVTYRAPEGTSLQQTTLIGERISREIRKVEGVDFTVLTVGSAEGDISGRGSNEGSILVSLVPPSQRDKSQDDLLGFVRDHVLPPFVESEQLKTIVSPLGGFGGGGAASARIQFVLSGPDIDKLDEYSQILVKKLAELPGVVDPNTTLITGRPSLEVQIDRERAADMGVTVTGIANAMLLTVGGLEVTDFAEGSRRFDVVLRAPLEARSNPDEIANITIPTNTGGVVRLGDVAKIVPTTGPAVIEHLARQRQVTVYANVTPGTSEAAIIEALTRWADELNMEPGYTAGLTGQSKELGRAAQGFLIAVVLSLVFMYLVLAAQYESWIHPITILMSLPLTIPFALLSLFVANQSLNVFSMLGVLVLFGVVKKNSILQVDHIRALRRDGFSRADSVMIGNRDRLRPILMTTIAFVAGMVPLVFSSGAGAGTNRAMGTVIMGGQTLSLLLTLLATPVVYSWLDDISHSPLVKSVIHALLLPVRVFDRLLTRDPSAQVSPEEAPQPARTADNHPAAE